MLKSLIPHKLKLVFAIIAIGGISFSSFLVSNYSSKGEEIIKNINDISTSGISKIIIYEANSKELTFQSNEIEDINSFIQYFKSVRDKQEGEEFFHYSKSFYVDLSSEEGPVFQFYIGFHSPKDPLGYITVIRRTKWRTSYYKRISSRNIKSWFSKKKLI